MSTLKDDLTEKLRSCLLSELGVAETRRADSGLTTLSFQSLAIPNRHVWIDTDLAGKISIDLEDWSDSEKWDNTIGSFTVDIHSVSKIAVLWLKGESLDSCRVFTKLSRG